MNILQYIIKKYLFWRIYIESKKYIKIFHYKTFLLMDTKEKGHDIKNILKYKHYQKQLDKISLKKDQLQFEYYSRFYSNYIKNSIYSDIGKIIGFNENEIVCYINDDTISSIKGKYNWAEKQNCIVFRTMFLSKEMLDRIIYYLRIPKKEVFQYKYIIFPIDKNIIQNYKSLNFGKKITLNEIKFKIKGEYYENIKVHLG